MLKLAIGMALQVDSTPSREVQHVEQQVTLPSDMENKGISGLSQAGTYPEGGKGWFVLIGGFFIVSGTFGLVNSWVRQRFTFRALISTVLGSPRFNN
ncbi:hypothetical protein FRC02_009690 [Tulasnella sp. 418]|nr:hypothetical protein FRC02_009690 [Tulasnella sp. 418]